VGVEASGVLEEGADSHHWAADVAIGAPQQIAPEDLWVVIVVVHWVAWKLLH
jgi:hypothetical protein